MAVTGLPALAMIILLAPFPAVQAMLNEAPFTAGNDKLLVATVGGAAVTICEKISKINVYKVFMSFNFFVKLRHLYNSGIWNGMKCYI
jgi:hypothetical protein